MASLIFYEISPQNNSFVLMYSYVVSVCFPACITGFFPRKFNGYMICIQSMYQVPLDTWLTCNLRIKKVHVYMTCMQSMRTWIACKSYIYWTFNRCTRFNRYMTCMQVFLSIEPLGKNHDVFYPTFNNPVCSTLFIDTKKDTTK